MQIRDIMTKDVVSVTPDTLITDVADILHRNNFFGVPVVSESGIVIGIVTERELFTADYGFHLPTYVKILKDTDVVVGDKRKMPYEAGHLTRLRAKEVVNRNNFFVLPEMPLTKLATKFALEGISMLAVTDSDNRLLGVISLTDLLKIYSGAALKVPADHRERYVDEEFQFVEKDMSKRFTLVSKSRASTWLTIAIIFFIIGFAVGVAYVIDLY